MTDAAPASHGGALLAGLLTEHGVRHVFGVPGGQTLALYDAILDTGALRHVLVRDERSAAYAADAYARITGTEAPRASPRPDGSFAAPGPTVASQTPALPVTLA